MDGKVWRSLVPEACCRYVYTNLHIMTWLAPLSPICLILALGLHLTCYISFHALSAAERRNVIHFKPFLFWGDWIFFFTSACSFLYNTNFRSDYNVHIVCLLELYRTPTVCKKKLHCLCRMKHAYKIVGVKFPMWSLYFGGVDQWKWIMLNCAGYLDSSSGTSKINFMFPF
jgi:hypothetical protein